MIKFKFAGYTAERRGSGGDPRFAARGDFHQATLLTEQLRTEYPESAGSEDSLMREVEAMFDQSETWNAVRALGDALEISGEVGGRRAKEIITQAGAHGPPPGT